MAFFFSFSLFLRVYLQKTKYLCINEIKLLAKLKRISVKFSSHQYNEFVRAVVSFNNCNKNATKGSWTPVLCVFLLCGYYVPAQGQRLRLCSDARYLLSDSEKSVRERTNSN